MNQKYVALDAEPWGDLTEAQASLAPTLFVFIGDGSGSMSEPDGSQGATRWRAGTRGLAELAGTLVDRFGALRPGTPPEGAPPLAYALVGVFGRAPAWSELLTPEQLEAYDLEAARRRIDGGATGVARALAEARPAIQKALAEIARRAGRAARPHAVLVLVTDGHECCGGDPGAEADALKADGHRLLVVGCGKGVDEAVLRRCASRGDYVPVGDADALETALMDHVSRTVAQALEPSR